MMPPKFGRQNEAILYDWEEASHSPGFFSKLREFEGYVDATGNNIFHMLWPGK